MTNRRNDSPTRAQADTLIHKLVDVGQSRIMSTGWIEVDRVRNGVRELFYIKPDGTVLDASDTATAWI